MAINPRTPPLDQILSYHRFSDYCFELSGLRTGSIRDQMIRGQLVAQSLYSNKIIDSTKSLLIAGAGVAGVTCALTAAKLGVPTFLLDLLSGPFNTQKSVTGRRLDPVEFDWPHPHWNSGRIPGPPNQLPLAFLPSSANVSAIRWHRGLMAWVRQQILTPNPSFGALRFLWGVDARTLHYADIPAVSGGGVVVTGHGSTAAFGAVVSCIGFSGEKVSVPLTGNPTQNYQGFEFWGYDPIGAPSFGQAAVKVLISGGGDGAQQDFLRALTGDFGIALYKRIETVALLPPLPAFFDATLAEDIARRSFTWRRGGQSLPATLHDWNEVYLRIVGDVLAQWTASQISQVRQAVLRPKVSATWVLGGDTPSFSYGLNRFLSLLIAKLHADATGRPFETPTSASGFAAPTNEVVVRGKSLREVKPQPGHVCGNPSICYGTPHEAVVASASTGSTRTTMGPFELIIIRHGVDQLPLLGSSPILEQITPMMPPR